MDYQLQNTVCKHIHAVVQLCRVALVGCNTETEDQKDVVNIQEQQSDVYFDNEPYDSSLSNNTADTSVNNQPDNSSHVAAEIPLNIQTNHSPPNAAEMDVSLEIECSSMNDSEGQLKKVDELMNTIRGSLVACLDRNLFDVANERYETLAAQIYAATANGSAGASTNL